MLLKYTQAQKRIKQAGIGKPQRTPGGMAKLSSGLMSTMPKIHRKVIKAANKRPGGVHRTPAAVKREQISVDPCDNSNDSGLGFDHHLDFHHAASLVPHSSLPLRFSDKEAVWPSEESSEVKRRRLEIKLESDDANDNFTFPETVRQPTPRTICLPVRGRSRVVVPVTLTSQLTASSHNGITQLLIVCQPEQQHRARYQTEGSRGAVKDRTGNSFPIVKLVGYDRPATLQVFIGTDQGRVAPHMFYQACRVSGKNSTPCVEKKIDGTIVIEVDIEPSKDMVVTCDCVGILKERNVDVEHRFPEEGSGRSKKKSTRCRMVFRTSITHPDGSQETLQVTSQPIVCTQPPGVPEICKKSLVSCSVRGGQELFVLGKNFLKDTRVVFQEGDGPSPVWSQAVQPDKEFLQQSHLVCVVPPYRTPDISEPVSVRLVVESSGKASEPHSFLYLPADTAVLAAEGNIVNSSVVSQGGSTSGFTPHLSVPPPLQPPPPFVVTQTSPGTEEKVHSSLMWEKPVPVELMMPPPACLPIALRRSSVQMIVPDPLPVPEDLKREIPESVDPPKPMATVSDLSSTQQPSLDTFRRFVSNNSLPSINVGSYLSNIESTSVYANKLMKPQVMSEMPRIMIPSPTSTNKSIFSGDSSNLLTTVEPILVNQSAMPFDGRNISVNSSTSQSPQENLSVIVSSSMIQKSPNPHLTEEGQHQKQIGDPPNNGGLELLIPSGMKKRAPTMTERLDAFVNSAAESHISPNPTSPISMTSVITESSVMNPIREMVVTGTKDMNKIQEAKILPMMQTPSLPISPHMSPHNGNTNLNESSLCSLLDPAVQTPSQTSSAQAQAALEHHLNTQSANASQAKMSNLMQSPQQVTMGQSEGFTNLQASIEQQLSSHAGTPPHSSHADMNTLMQPPHQAAVSQVQVLSNLQASLEQQLSPQTGNSSQMNHPDLSNLLQPPSQVTTTQAQDLSNLQATLEQQLSSQTMTSSDLNHPDLSNLMQSSPQNSRSGVQDLSNLQVSLEHHLSSQTINSTQMIHSESVQPSNLSLNGLGVMQTPSANEVQALSNLQASLGCHLSSQVIDSVQPNHESMTSGSISLNSLNPSVSTSPQIQSVVSQAHALSTFRTSLEQLSSQVIGSSPSMPPNSHSPNSLHSSLENSPQVSTNQAQTFSNLQMSLENLTSQVLNPAQPNHDSASVGSLSLNNPVQTSAQVQVAVTEAQTLSNLQASLEHHLNTRVMATNQSSPESMMPLERLSSSVQPPNQTLSSLQISIDQLSSQVLAPSQSGHSESLTPNNISIDNPQSVDLMSPQGVIIANNNATSSPVMLQSPNSHRSPSSVLTSPGISLSNSPTMALSPTVSLSPTNLSLHNSQPMEINSSDIVLRNSPTLLATDLSMNNPSTLSLSSAALQMQNLQSASIQQSGIGQFEQVTSNMSQSLPVVMGPYEQQQQQQQQVQMQVSSKEPERKEPSGYMMQEEQVRVPQASSTVKKCEDGMPLPHELTQMSEHDLISYINPSCFDTV